MSGPSLRTTRSAGPPERHRPSKRRCEGCARPAIPLREMVRETGLSLQTLRAIVGCQATGRPLRASEAQQAQVRMLRGAGKTVRQIAHETKLSFQTIRTIIGRKDALDRTTKRKHHLEKIKLKSPPRNLFTRPYADRGRAPRPNQRSDPGGRTPA